MNSVVSFALRQRTIVLLMFITLMIGGLLAFRQLNIEAYPDPTPPSVEVVTQVAGLSAEEVERYITIPVEVATSGLPNLKTVRSISLYGLSSVKLQFTFDFTYREAEQQVLNRLAQLQSLPNGAQPGISPVSPIGEIYRYRLVGPPGYSVMDLKTLNDWVLKRRFRAVPGVIDVTSWGGKTKTYEIKVDLDRLVAYGLTLPQVVQSLNNSNLNVGGNTVNIGSQSAVVRGVGLIRSANDIEATMLTQVNGSPVLVRDVASVEVGFQPRLGIAGLLDDDDVVQGIVLMRRGERSMPVLNAVHDEVQRIERENVLPPGVKIERIYDREELINTTTHTVLHNMVIGILLIVLIQWLFLGDLRSALIIATTIPFALFFAIALMVARGESANLLSVGAIDFGLIVDATVIMVEAIYRRLSHGAEQGDDPADTMAYTGLTGRLKEIAAAAAGVNRSIFFAACIIVAAFIPLFTMSGVEGHIFGPMAKTYAYALAGGLLATFTVTPALAAFILPKQVKETETPLVRFLTRVYEPTLVVILRMRGAVIVAALVIVATTFIVVRMLGLEFLPKLEEGNMWIRATLPTTISLEEGNQYVNRMRQTISELPEFQTVLSQHGRPDDGTDATGFFNAEFFAPLRPVSQWRPGVTKDSLTDEVLAKLQGKFPGVEFNFSQYLQDNVAEAVSGVKGENSIKIYGGDLNTLADLAQKIKTTLSTVQGIEDLAVFVSLGQPTVQIEVDRAKAARYGLAPGDINTAVQIAIGGQAAGDLFEAGGDRHFPIVVRLAPRFRQSIEAINNLRIGVNTPAGTVTQIPLSEVAKVSLTSGAAYIYREQQTRYLPVKFSVRDRDLGSTILEAQQRIAKEVVLPPGYRLEWVGEFGNLQDAIARLAVVVPLSLLLMAALLYFNFGSLTDTVLALTVIPLALVGGVAALAITGTPFSVSAAIGFIALFGIAVMDGILVITHFNHLMAQGYERLNAIRETCHTQMRPVVMTCIVAGVGLLPAAWSHGVGSQVQKPLALVVVGGMTLAPILILFILPVLIYSFSRRGQARQTGNEPASPHSPLGAPTPGE
ncbi:MULTISPECIES: CusA/CzcA family heavy metal efflux RND transporter [unclassified Beijerinckia]|uniref:efflux RND transporter permease subunit n=1 Tax=unclassified Beijerinckia TaxID=2638183 RepID=UPI000897EC07|nr:MULTISPECIES: CusA/CzcA family heavy metal efflux RND transporter [unclassified Beijerinckia]MDH7796691.1 cobalt-zinc-cadmium resistance protein CzcA [Beijerinckia sp. GAS462]SEC55899.1 cobalt-zinc-cadmium resistance protein CzcA [Beijerinckia sp. 28-YEA-48]